MRRIILYSCFFILSLPSNAQSLSRYDLHFETVADFSSIAAGGREAAIRAAMSRYAQLLEQYCHAAPYNWFNFFDFWQPAPAGSRAPTRHG